MTWFKVCPVVMCLPDVGFLTPTAYFLNYFFPQNISFVCIGSLMRIGSFSLCASLNLSPRREGHVSCIVRTLPLVVQSRHGLEQRCHRVYSALFLGWNCQVLKRVYALKKQNAVCCWYPVDESQTRKKMFANPICDKGIVSTMCNSENSTIRKQTDPWKCGPKSSPKRMR